MNLMVLIPTIGRESLNNVIREVLDDADSAKLHVTVFIGLNGVLDPNVKIPKKIRILKISDKPIGVGECVNRALMMIPPGLLWTISDDDDWLAGKFACDLQYREKLEDGESVLLPRVILIDTFGKSVRPKIEIGSQSLQSYLYGYISLWRNPRYVTMSGACAHTTFWGRVKFESLPVREDIVYLIEQERLGTHFIQPVQPTIQININFNRGLARDIDIFAAIEWQKRYLAPEQLIGFLGSAWPKPFAASGRPKEIGRLLRQINRKNFGDSSYFRLALINLLLAFWIIVAKIVQRNSK
jgi:hypothetical protein